MGSSKDFRRLGDDTSSYFKKGAQVKVVKKANVNTTSGSNSFNKEVRVNSDRKEYKPNSKPGFKKPFNNSGKPQGKPFNKNGFKPKGKFDNKGKDGKFSNNKFKKKPYIKKQAGNKGVGFESSNYNQLIKDKKIKVKAQPKGLNIHRWMSAHDGIQAPRNILKVTIAQALATVTHLDTRIEGLLNYLNVTTPKKETMKEYNCKLHTLVDLQNRRKGITSVLHKQNALITINFDFEGVSYTQTIDMLLLTIRELKKMLGILAKDPKSKTNNKTNPFNGTKKQMITLLELLSNKLSEYNRVTTIEIPR